MAAVRKDRDTCRPINPQAHQKHGPTEIIGPGRPSEKPGAGIYGRTHSAEYPLRNPGR